MNSYKVTTRSCHPRAGGDPESTPLDASLRWHDTAIFKGKKGGE